MSRCIKAMLAATLLFLTACAGESWEDHQGNSLTNADLEGRWVVVNYWAEWCAPCLEELPELNALNQVSEDIRVLGVHFDGYQGEALRELADRMDIRFPVMSHEFAAARGMAMPQVLPTTYIINPQGEVVHSLQGPQDEAGLLALMTN